MKAVRGFVVTLVWVTALITFTGAILGAGIWPLVGLATGAKVLPGTLALHGARDLGFYFFIWAPGAGIVVAVMREWRRRHPSE